jgi:regulator of protease activity HflC (stomatin/prohibitin superfamily)
MVSDREDIVDDLTNDLNARLANMGIAVTGYQLLSVDWDDKIDDKIMEAVVAFEDIKTAFAEKNISKIEAETSVKKAEIMSESVTINANKTAELLIASKKAEASVISLQGLAQSEAYAAVKTNMGLDNEQLLKFVYLKEIVGGGHAEKKISVSVPTQVQDELDGWS